MVFDEGFAADFSSAAIALMTSIFLILASDRVGRRPIVVVAAIVCTTTMMIVGILGFVSKTEPLRNFLIFISCVWSLCNVARMLLNNPHPPNQSQHLPVSKY